MADRVERVMGVLAVAVIATGFLGWRTLGKAEAKPAGAQPAPVASPQLTQLIPFVAPVSDSQLVLRTSSDSIVLSRDPFSAPVVERVAESHASSGATHAAVTDSAQQWHVSATLISSARRAAIINDVLTYVGDRVPGGGKLVSVESDRVVLTDSRGALHTVKADKEGT